MSSPRYTYITPENITYTKRIANLLESYSKGRQGERGGGQRGSSRKVEKERGRRIKEKRKMGKGKGRRFEEERERGREE